VHYGDIAKGLRLPPSSCDLIFCSHVLEHLTLAELKSALRNTYCYLKEGGVFRLVVPNFEALATYYLSLSEPSAISNFMRYTHLGRVSRPRTLVEALREHYSSPYHLWMWDYKGLAEELAEAGFTDIRRYKFGESGNPLFKEVEIESRFEAEALAIECSKKNSKN
jgi:predicted SAM-dependent methyltransferase